jgi:hypothetical protein
MHGYRITALQPLRDGFVRVTEHREVCSEQAPRTEQHPLF